MPKITIDKNLCIQCKKCEKDCTSHAISIDTFSVNSHCILCGHCVAICETAAIRMNNHEPKPITKAFVTPEEFYNLSTNTRSCRHYKQKPVEDEIIQKLIKNIANYPSASNSRRVEITVLSNTEKIKELNQFTSKKLYNLFSFFTKPGIKQVISLIMGKKEMRKLEKYKVLFYKKMKSGMDNITYKAPVVVIFHGEKQASGMLQTDADIWSTYTSLYASTFGLGTCFNGFIVKALQKDKKAKKLFGIPENNTVFITLLIGYPVYSYTNEPGRDLPKYTII